MADNKPVPAKPLSTRTVDQAVSKTSINHILEDLREAADDDTYFEICGESAKTLRDYIVYLQTK